MKKFIVVLGAVLLLLFLCRSFWLVHAFFYWIYRAPVTATSLIAAFIAVIVFLLAWEDDSWEVAIPAMATAVVAGLVYLFWAFFGYGMMMVGLYDATSYQTVDTLIPVTEPRDVSYAEALTNFKKENPEAQFGPGDLDYVRSRWISDLGPATFWNYFSEPTQGFFVYDPDSEDKVSIVRQEMPFAESGALTNSDGFFVYQRYYFVEFHEVLYIEDSDYSTENFKAQMAVISLIKREGWRRVPYIWKILIVHGNGDTELLPPQLAEKDERLVGVQLVPEWLEAKKVEAWGYRAGAINAAMYKKGRIEIDKSVVNSENSPPYHLDTALGRYWYTPFGPYGKESQTGIAMHDSHDIDGTILFWQLPVDQAYQGADGLALQIKAAPHPKETNLLWVRKSGDSVTGVHDVIELLPLARVEGGSVVLYYMGFIAVDPPTESMFFTIINPATKEVFENLYSIDDVRRWLNGELQLGIQSKAGEPVQEIVTVPSFDDLTKLTSQELFDLLERIIEELKKRELNQ